MIDSHWKWWIVTGSDDPILVYNEGGPWFVVVMVVEYIGVWWFRMVRKVAIWQWWNTMASCASTTSLAWWDNCNWFLAVMTMMLPMMRIMLMDNHKVTTSWWRRCTVRCGPHIAGWISASYSWSFVRSKVWVSGFVISNLEGTRGMMKHEEPPGFGTGLWESRCQPLLREGITQLWGFSTVGDRDRDIKRNALLASAQVAMNESRGIILRHPAS